MYGTPKINKLPEEIRLFLIRVTRWYFRQDRNNSVGVLTIPEKEQSFLDGMMNWYDDVIESKVHLEVDFSCFIGMRPIDHRLGAIVGMHDFVMGVREMSESDIPSWFNYKEYLMEK